MLNTLQIIIIAMFLVAFVFVFIIGDYFDRRM